MRMHFLLGALLIAGCGSSDQVTTNYKTIGATGGQISLNSTVLTIPAGALAMDTVITLTQTGDSAPSGMSAYTPIYKYEPEGLQFLKPASVTFELPSPADSPSVFWSNAAGGFDDLRGKIVGRAITGSIMHFSKGYAGKGLGGIYVDAGVPDLMPPADLAVAADLATSD